MSNADTMRQFYDRVNAGDIDGFSALIADDMIEHEKIEGLPQTKEGVVQFFEMFRAAFSTCAWRRKTSSRAATRPGPEYA